MVQIVIVKDADGQLKMKSNVSAGETVCILDKVRASLVDQVVAAVGQEPALVLATGGIPAHLLRNGG